jgi:hypothetical protein
MKVEVIKMNVNILGKGLIPGLKMLAPVRNVDLDQQQIARILKVKSLKVTLVDSPDMITKNNLAIMFAPKTVSTEKVEKVEEKTPAEKLIEKAEDLGIEVAKEEDEEEAPVAEETIGIASIVADASDEMTLAEGLITEDTTYEVPVSNEEESVEEAPVEETPTEEKTSSGNEFKARKNKKNRHNK